VHASQPSHSAAPARSDPSALANTKAPSKPAIAKTIHRAFQAATSPQASLVAKVAQQLRLLLEKFRQPSFQYSNSNPKAPGMTCRAFFYMPITQSASAS
jgi:hypothetical protein